MATRRCRHHHMDNKHKDVPKKNLPTAHKYGLAHTDVRPDGAHNDVINLLQNTRGDITIIVLEEGFQSDNKHMDDLKKTPTEHKTYKNGH